ncbi:alpha-protein kinase 2 isoform X2 [Tamandua tetradactyla]
MICCSAYIEVECLSENPQFCPSSKDDADMGGRHATETSKEESTNPIDEKGHPYKEEESISPGTPTSNDSSTPEFSCFHSLLLLANNNINAASSKKPLDGQGTRQTQEAYDLNDTEDLEELLLFPNSSNTPEKQDVYCHRTMHSKVSEFTDSALDNNGPNEILNSSHQNPTAQKYISLSLPLSEATTPIYPGRSAKELCSQVSSEDSVSDYELCPEITQTYTEEFSDDDLEYLECSDVMTDYSNAVWRRNLQGTVHVFLLESDDEETEFSECCLGGSEHFLSEMGCQTQVSDNTGPMDATAGFCGYHSQPQEVGVKSSSASLHSPSSLRTGMTLILGPQRDGTSTVTDLGRSKPPTASEAAENDCPGIQGEMRDSHYTEQEFTSDNLLNMDKALTEMKLLSGELEKSGMNQYLETPVKKRVGEKDLSSKRGSPGTKGKPKKLNTKLKERTAEGAHNLLYPKEPVMHPLTSSEKRQSSHVRAEAADLNPQLHVEECAISTPAEQEEKILPTPKDSLPKGDANLKAEGMQVINLLETNQAPDQSDQPQVQIQETVRERIAVSQMPAFSEPAGEESPFPGTTTSSLPNLGGIHKENASLNQDQAVERYTRGPQHREDNTSGGFWRDLEQDRSISEAYHEHVCPCEHFPQNRSADLSEPETLSVVSSGPSNTVLNLENVCDGSKDREAGCLMECFEIGDKGTMENTMGSPVGAPVDTYLPQEICFKNLELAEGQSEVSYLYSPDDKTLEVLETQGSKPPQSTSESSQDRKSPVSPRFLSTFTWKMSQKANEGATGENLAEVENSTSTLAFTAKADGERLSPSHSRGLEERQPLSSKNIILQFEEGAVESSSTSVKNTTDTSTSGDSIMKFLQEKPIMLTANIETLQVTKESEFISSIPMATKVHPAKYLAVSVAENNYADDTEESLLQVSDEDIFQLPSNIQLGHILNGSTAESIQQLSCMAPSVPGIYAHVPQPTERESFYGTSRLQTNNASGDKSQTVDRTDNRKLTEHFQEKGSEIEQNFHQKSLPHKGFLSEDDFQECLHTTSAAQEEINLVPLDPSPESSREERGQSSGLVTSSFMVAEAAVENDAEALSNVPFFSKNLLEESKESGREHCEPVDKLKILTLGASISEIWPSSQLTDSKSKESEAVPIIHNKAWAISEVLKADVPMEELDSSEKVASPSSPQCKSDSTLAIKREICESKESASNTNWSSLSSQYLSQPSLLESSVDPIDGKESCVTNLLSEASMAGGKENVNNISQNQEENQVKMDHLAFLKQILTCPKILESSVDPIDETGVIECSRAEKPEPSESILRVVKEESTPNDGSLDQKVEVLPAILQVPCPEENERTIQSENSIDQSQEDCERGYAEQNKNEKAKVEVQPAILQALCPHKGRKTIPSECSINQIQEGSKGSLGEAEQSKHGKAELIIPTLPLSKCPAIMTHSSVAGQMHDTPKNDLVEFKNHQCVFPDSNESGNNENEHAKHLPSSSGLALSLFTSSPEGNISNLSICNQLEKPKIEAPQIEKNKPPNSSGLPAVTVAFTPGEYVSGKASKLLQDPCQKGSILGSMKKSRAEEKPLHRTAKMDQFPGALPGVPGPEEVKKKHESSGSVHLAEGMKKKILSRVAALRLRLEEKEKVRKNSSFIKKIPKLETSASRTDEKKDQKKPPCKTEEKAPVLLKRIQAEMFPDQPGNIKLSCQFAEIHEDSTIWWTKDSKSIAQVQRSAGDNSTVSLAIIQASQKDQGLYCCCIENSYGKATAEFSLTAGVLKQLSSHQDIKGWEEIEFSQLIFREDFLSDSYFGSSLRGQIATEELHFGEGVHRKAFRSRVMHGLTPVFKPGHACVLKVHNAITYGTRNNDELVQKNYKLAAQECYVQNTARHYAKIYAAEAQPLEGFGEVPEIIPIFLIRRPENNIPYATVEEELIGEFVKYSIRDGKEINFLRRESEAGQKCCTFQHWVYQKTSGCLLVTDMQGVGMKLTDVGIATLAKGYRGFKGNCSMTFIEQFKALHQCNKYCKMLGLKSLQNNQKQKKPSAGKSQVQPSSTTAKKTASGIPAEKKNLTSPIN